MFGYIQPDKPEMKIREYNQFRTYYCGLCKAIGKRSGQLLRLSLNNDMTFFALLLSSTFGIEGKLHREGCLVNPLKKKMIRRENPFLEYAADMNVLLTYYKLKDDWEDDRNIPAFAGKSFICRHYSQVKKRYPEKTKKIEHLFDELSGLERCGSDSIDQVSGCFAAIMEEIVDPPPCMIEKCGLSDADIENRRKVLRWIGYNLGKWIYLIDAYDDLEKDILKKRFNVLQNRFQKEETESFSSFRLRIRDRIQFLLTQCLAQAGKGFELLTFAADKDIIHNIIYSGMRKRMEQILLKGSVENSEESV